MEALQKVRVKNPEPTMNFHQENQTGVGGDEDSTPVFSLGSGRWKVFLLLYLHALAESSIFS